MLLRIFQFNLILIQLRNPFRFYTCLLFISALAGAKVSATTIWLNDLDVSPMIQGSGDPWTCGGCTGSWQHDQEDADQYAAWGFDYLKYDLCSYHDVVPDCETVLAPVQKPYRVMGEFLKQQPRDIVYSLCQYGGLNVWQWGASVGGHAWRTTGDIVDTWNSMKGKWHVRDLWRQKDLGKFKNAFSATGPRHGVVLIKVW